MSIALVVALAGAIAVWALDRSDPVEGGPLAYDEGYGDSLAFTVPLDTVYSWGLPVLENSGNVEAVIERVSLVDESGSIREIGVRAVAHTAEDAVGFAPGFDPDAGQDVAGLVVPPGKDNGFQLVFGLEVTDPGIARFHGVRVDYRVGTRHFVTTLNHVVALCAPVEQYDECG